MIASAFPIFPRENPAANSASSLETLHFSTKYFSTAVPGTGLVARRIHLERIVSKNAPLFVVSKKITAYSGGSSIVFKMAFCAAAFIFSASSTI